MHMRALLCTALLLASSPALAAADDWTGWHVGVSAGHGRGDSDADVALGGQWSVESQALRDHVAGTWSHGLDPSGGAYGVQAGYDFHFDGGLVVGVEAEYARLGLDDTRRTGAQPVPSIPSLSYDFGNRIELDAMASLRARIGYAFDRHLVYLTGGWARVDAEASASVLSNGGYDKLGRRSDTLDGTAWGAGYAVAFGNGWSIRAEYLRADFDEMAFETGYQPGSTFTSPEYTETIRQDVAFDLFRLGIDYRF